MATAKPKMPVYHGTVVPFRTFDANKDATLLRNSMKGVGTNEAAIIGVVTTRTNSQRQQIIPAYEHDFQRNLMEDIKSELSGHFKHVVKVMFMQPAEYDAYSLHKAMKGLGTTESTLVEILFSRTDDVIKQIGEFYKKKYNHVLADSLMNDTSGDFRNLCVCLDTDTREKVSPVNQVNAYDDAKRLYDAGENRWGTDESVFISVMTSKSFPHLRQVFVEYEKISKKDIIDSIKSEFSGNMKDGMISMVEMVRNAPSYFAKKLYDCMHGAGTRDTDLIRIIVTRSEIDMVEIKKEFQALYTKSLADFIKDDTSGDYKAVLLGLIGD